MQKQSSAVCTTAGGERFTKSEPGVGAPSAELAHCNLVEAVRLQADWATNGQTRLLGNTLFAIGASRFPAAPFNAVIRLGNEPADDHVLARSQEVFAEQRRGFSVYVRDTTDRELEQQCRVSGLLPSGTMPVMVTSRPAHNYFCPDDVELEIVKTTIRVEHFVEVASVAFADTGLSRSVVTTAFGRPNRVLSSPAELGILRANGCDVACGALVYSGAVAGLYWVGTPPAFRGCGLGSACTQLLAEHAFRNGCCSVILQASPQAVSLYRRLGFEEVQRIRCYTWPFGVVRQGEAKGQPPAAQTAWP